MAYGLCVAGLGPAGGWLAVVVLQGGAMKRADSKTTTRIGVSRLAAPGLRPAWPEWQGAGAATWLDGEERAPVNLRGCWFRAERLVADVAAD